MVLNSWLVSGWGLVKRRSVLMWKKQWRISCSAMLCYAFTLLTNRHSVQGCTEYSICILFGPNSRPNSIRIRPNGAGCPNTITYPQSYVSVPSEWRFSAAGDVCLDKHSCLLAENALGISQGRCTDQLGLTFSQSLLYEAETAHLPWEIPNVQREA